MKHKTRRGLQYPVSALWIFAQCILSDLKYLVCKMNQGLLKVGFSAFFFFFLILFHSLDNALMKHSVSVNTGAVAAPLEERGQKSRWDCEISKSQD